MLKVLYLTDDLGNGGAQRQLALLVKYLPPEWERQVWSMDGGPYVEVIRKLSAPLMVYERAWRWDFSPAIELWQTITHWHPDVVHSWGWMCSAAAGPICKFMSIPLVDGTIRAGMVSLRWGLVHHWNMRLAYRVIANSQAGLTAWRIGTEKGRVVHNGFDPERLALCTRRQLETRTPFTVVMTGRMHKHKDYCTFFSAARKVIESTGQDWRFFAVGNGPDRNALMKEAQELNHLGIASFPEMGSEVLEIIRDAHIGVLMSNPLFHAEGCSNSIMEYMACGLPVVCSDGGGNRELVIDGETGFVIPPTDPSALAEKLVWLRSHREEAKRMGRAGQSRIMREFTVGNMISRTVSIYEEVVSG